MDKLRVAVIGSGTIANAAHIPAWRDQPGVELVGVADSVIENAASTARRHGIPYACDDVASMLAEVRPGAVSVCSPAHCHKDHAIAALRAGAHVLCEKPLALDAGEAAEMYREAEAAGRLLLAGQSMRFYNQIAAAREFVAQGQVGEIYYADAARLRRRGVPVHGTFHLKALSRGGVLYDLGAHVLDTLLWIMGNPAVVAASGVTYTKLANREEGLITSLADSGAPVGVFAARTYSPREFDVEDLAAAFLRLENGATITIRVSWAANVPESAGGISIMGTEGGLWFNPQVMDLRLVRNMGCYQVDVTPKLPPRVPDHAFYAHWKEIAHFIRAIRGEEELCVKKEEVLNAIRALEAIYASAAQGSEVRLEAAREARGGAE
ncbi:MAG: Gfo/Idh/MocA family oxidoreductase [Acidobacteria bacterium]|nr:Gfo/Idh/MocA family oxidoreductase [Acidobacteriota bacterium]MCL5744959.1 Gfo/Idh/MocA family oxidoreductase [Acidobacteriota bacterium]